MCGIITVKRFDKHPVIRMARRQYDQQKERGTEGFGFITVKDGVFDKFMKSETEEAIMQSLSEQTANEIVFHHRNPTSTVNLWEAAHPIEVSHPDLKYNYYVVHNGSIKNHEFLKKEHDKLKYAYSTEIVEYAESVRGNRKETGRKYNDSECFAIELARDLDGLCVGMGQIEGNIAFVCLQVEKTSKRVRRMYWGRNYGSPLKFFKDKWYMSILSTGKGEDVAAHTLNWYDYATGQIDHKVNFTVGRTPYTPSETPRYGFNFNRGAGYDNKTLALTGRGSQTWERDFDQYLEDWQELNGIELMLYDKNISVADKVFIGKKRGELKEKIAAYEKKYPVI